MSQEFPKNPLDNIYAYSDAQIFVSDYFAFKKFKDPDFSVREFAKKISISNQLFCRFVLTGHGIVSVSITGIIGATSKLL